MQALSYTMMSSYNKCPLQFKLVYIDKKEKYAPETDALILGKTVHSIIETAVGYLKKNPIMSNRKALDDALEQVLQTEKINADIEQEIRKIIGNMDADLLKTFKGIEFESEKQVALNRDLKPVDFNSPDAVFRGIFDFVWIEEFLGMKTVNIIDFKTNQQKNADKLQLDYYAFLAKHWYENVDNINVMFWYVRYTGKEAFSHYNYTYDSVDDNYFIETRNILETLEVFEPKPGAHCNWCPVAVHCPLANITEEQAQQMPVEQLLDLYLPLKRALTTIEEKIKAELETKESISGNHVKVVKKTYTRKILDEDGIRKLLLDIKVTPEQLLNAVNITQTMLKKMNLELPKELYVEQKDTKIEFVDLN